MRYTHPVKLHQTKKYSRELLIFDQGRTLKWWSTLWGSGILFWNSLCTTPYIGPIRQITNYMKSQDHTSPLNSRKTLKLLSFLKLGCAARRVRNTSCIATVFLNVARYSLKDTHNSASPGIWVGWGGGWGGMGRRGESCQWRNGYKLWVGMETKCNKHSEQTLAGWQMCTVCNVSCNLTVMSHVVFAKLCGKTSETDTDLLTLPVLVSFFGTLPLSLFLLLITDKCETQSPTYFIQNQFLVQN